MTPTVSAYGSGRSGNNFFRNMATHFIAERNNIKPIYVDEETLKQLGIFLFQYEGKVFNHCSHNIQLNENSFMQLMTKSQNISSNLQMNLNF